MLIKKFNFIQKETLILKIFSFRNKKFFALKVHSQTAYNYLIIPCFIEIRKEGSNLVFSTEKENFNPVLQNFYKSFQFFLKNNEKIFYKKLLLKGLGFKLAIFKTISFNHSRHLRLKVGYSHFVYIAIPGELLISTNKKRTVLNIKSKNSVLLGNFCSSLKRVKKINIYNGKGFWYKNEKKTLKLFKKK